MELDQDVVNLAKAIRQAESGNRAVLPQEGSQVGGASRYQYTHDTWKGVAQKYLGDANAPLTLQNENKASYLRIKEWKDSGKNVGQIASMWNAGEGKPNAYRENWRGVNKHGVVYDTPAYARKVATAYQGFKQETMPKVAQAETVVPQPAKEPFSLSQLGKEIISPVTTMLARPFQAIDLGSQMIRTGGDNKEFEAKSKQYSDESYKLSMQARNMPAGPEREAVMAKAKEAANLGQYYSERLSQNTSYQPFSTDTLVKEAPQNFGDVKKDVGRGIQTVAFGMGPVSGGAAFGTGMSLEQGNDLLSWDTLAYTVGGAALGKAADIIGKPLFNAAGKVVGVITPEVLKNVAAGGARAVQVFMEKNKLLPDAVSRPINIGAEALERGANAPFNAATAPFRQTDDKIIANRQKALQDLEEKYAQLRDNAARDPKATAATRERVARSNVLAEDNMINPDGVIIGAKQAAKNYRNENIGEGESLVRQLIQKEGVAVDLDVVERELVKVIKESFNGRELITAMNAVKREMAGLRSANRNGRITLVDVHDAKVSRQPGSKAYDNSETKAVDKQIARAHKQVVEKNSKERVKEINAEIAKFLGDAEYIESLQGKRIGSGKLGKALATAGSAVAGAVAGGAVGGIPGAVVGSFAAKAAGERIASGSLRRALGKATSKKTPPSKVFESGRARLNEKQLALPPGPKLGTSGNPIITPVRSKGPGPVSRLAEKGEPVRNPKTGRFERTYLSGEKGLTPDQIVDIKKNTPLKSPQMAKLIATKAQEAADGKIFGFTSNLDGTEYVGKDANHNLAVENSLTSRCIRGKYRKDSKRTRRSLWQ
jgi:hypothetical protein